MSILRPKDGKYVDQIQNADNRQQETDNGQRTTDNGKRTTEIRAVGMFCGGGG